MILPWIFHDFLYSSRGVAEEGSQALAHIFLCPVVYVLVNASLELVDVLGHNSCLRKSIPVIWVNKYFCISNLECSLVILNGCPLVADCSFSVTKKSAGSMLSNPIGQLAGAYFPESWCSTLSTFLDIPCLKSGIIPVTLLCTLSNKLITMKYILLKTLSKIKIVKKLLIVPSDIILLIIILSFCDTHLYEYV